MVMAVRSATRASGYSLDQAALSHRQFQMQTGCLGMLGWHLGLCRLIMRLWSPGKPAQSLKPSLGSSPQQYQGDVRLPRVGCTRPRILIPSHAHLDTLANLGAWETKCQSLAARLRLSYRAHPPYLCRQRQHGRRTISVAVPAELACSTKEPSRLGYSEQRRD